MPMPRYDYRCPACETVFEVEHGMREHPEVSCPRCGAPMTRVLNTSGIVFKGSGFYNTDMRGKKGGTEATGAGKGEESTALAKNADKPAATPKAESGTGSSTSSGSASEGAKA